MIRSREKVCSAATLYCQLVWRVSDSGHCTKTELGSEASDRNPQGRRPRG